MKPKILFVDDSSRRIRAALTEYGTEYDVTIAPNVTEALRAMSERAFDIVHLDHDLNGTAFQDPDSNQSAMEIIRYIQKNGWPWDTRPTFRVHSYNSFAAHNMIGCLGSMGFTATLSRLVYPKYEIGIVAGAFDVIHPGYIRMFRYAKTICNYLVVALNISPAGKPMPILSADARTEILLSIRYVDDVWPYSSEELLTIYLESVDVRIVGSDHKDSTSRPKLKIPTYYHDRSHGWSSTKFKKMIAEAMV